MHLYLRLILTGSLFAVFLPSCKREAVVDTSLAIIQMERLKIVTDALHFPRATRKGEHGLEPFVRPTPNDDRAQKIVLLQTLLNEDAEKESNAYIQAIKSRSAGEMIPPPPPIRFAKPSGHDYLPELTDVQIERLRKVIEELEQFFSTQDHSIVFLRVLDNCKNVLDEQPDRVRLRISY
jgi:hypothetical protein